MAARSRLPLIATLALGGAGGYYLYNAGGRPKVAEKQFERMFSIAAQTLSPLITCIDDAARLSSKVRSEFPGKEKEVKTEAKLYGEQAKQYGEQIGDKVDETVSIQYYREANVTSWLTIKKARISKGKEQGVRNPIASQDCRGREGARKVQEGCWQGA